jgi:cobalt-zinc-cadmium efflux system protein
MHLPWYQSNKKNPPQRRRGRGEKTFSHEIHENQKTLAVFLCISCNPCTPCDPWSRFLRALCVSAVYLSLSECGRDALFFCNLRYNVETQIKEFNQEFTNDMGQGNPIPHQHSGCVHINTETDTEHSPACGPGPGCTHAHGSITETSGSRLLITLGLNLVIPIVQVIGGIQAHSMALISDAAHNFSDFAAVLIAYLANRIGKRGASAEFTFGYRRAEILAAALNVMILFGVSAFIVYEGISRVFHPESVLANIVIVVAAIGVLGNGFSAWLLHKDAGHNLNVKGAFLHMLGDLFTSAAVVVNGFVLLYKPWYWLDPALSILIAFFIIKNCWGILKEAVCILMNGTPVGLDLHRIKKFMESLPGVKNVHYLHAWNLCSSSVAFSCHVVVPDQNLSEIDHISKDMRIKLMERFGIDHPILQFETGQCGDGNMFCGLSCGNINKGPEATK